MIDRRKSLQFYLQFLDELEESLRLDESMNLTFEIVSKNGQVFVMDIKEKTKKLKLIPGGDNEGD